MTWRMAVLVGITVASGFPPPLRTVAAELPRDLAEARSAKAGSRTFAQSPRAEMSRVPQFDNDRAVSWRSVIPPHTESTLHRHDRYRTVIGIVGGDLTTVSADGRRTVTRYETGKAYWQEPMPASQMHKDVNDTSRTIELVVVEIK
jgi:hypothetical protein